MDPFGSFVGVRAEKNGCNVVTILMVNKRRTFFGSSVALNAAGNKTVIGAPQTGDSSKRGLAYVYKWDNDKKRWQKRGSCIEGTDGGDVFGSSVSISSPGNTIAVGAYLHDGSSGENGGHVRVFDWNTDTKSWSQRGEDIEGENEYDSSGYSVALSADGDTVASGARDTDDGAGYQAGHVRVFDWKNDDGEPTVCPDVIAPLFCEGIKQDTYECSIGRTTTENLLFVRMSLPRCFVKESSMTTHVSQRRLDSWKPNVL